MLLAWLPLTMITAHTSASGTSQTNLSANYADRISEGDLVFRRGKGRWSSMFAAGNPNTGFSHVGVIDRAGGQSNTDIYVLHADADDASWAGGVQRTPLVDFLRDSEFYEFRRNRMTDTQRDTFMLALRQAWNQEIPFDTKFTLADNGSSLYCTEYVWWAAKAAGVNLASPMRLMGVDVITVDAIYASPVFDGL